MYISGADPQADVREGVTGVAQIDWGQNFAWGPNFGFVKVNGQGMSTLPYHPRHVKQSVFLLAQPFRDRVLVLGLGGANIVEALVEDPQVEHIDVVDWSYELPALLSEGRAAEALHFALSSPKVRLFKADARVAVSLFEKGSFDLVFDNLGFPNWIGASSINSAT